MSAAFPIGAFARGRRDWSVEALMLASGYSPEPGGADPRFSLNNDGSGNGLSLAVYGILAWMAQPNAAAMALVSQDPLVSSGAPYNYVIGPIVTGNPSIAGFMTLDYPSSGHGSPLGVAFKANGASWLTLGDCPLFVIPPGYALGVRPTNINVNVNFNTPFACSFVWGYYYPKRSIKFHIG